MSILENCPTFQLEGLFIQKKKNLASIYDILEGLFLHWSGFQTEMAEELKHKPLDHHHSFQWWFMS